MGKLKAIEGAVKLTPNEVRLIRAIVRPDSISVKPEPDVEVAIMREGGDRYVMIQSGQDFIEILTAKSD